MRQKLKADGPEKLDLEGLIPVNLMLRLYLSSFMPKDSCEQVYIPQGTVKKVQTQMGWKSLYVSHDLLCVNPQLGVFHIVKKQNADDVWLEGSPFFNYIYCGHVSLTGSSCSYILKADNRPHQLINYNESQLSQAAYEACKSVFVNHKNGNAFIYEPGRAVESITEDYKFYFKSAVALIIRASKNHPDRVIIERQQDYLGQGAYGCVNETAALYFENTQKYTTKKQRVMKRIFLKETVEEKDINNEYEIAKEMGLKPKQPIYNSRKQNAYMLMWKVPGITLYQYLDNHRTRTLEAAYQISIRCLESLNALHEKDILHGDIKHNNIMMDPTDFQCRLIDAGLAVSKGVQERYTAAQGLHCPEYHVLRADFKLLYKSKQTDAYAMGLVLREVWGYAYENDPNNENAFCLGRKASKVTNIDNRQQYLAYKTLNRMLSKAPEERMSVAAALKQFKDNYEAHLRQKAQAAKEASPDRPGLK